MIVHLKRGSILQSVLNDVWWAGLNIENIGQDREYMYRTTLRQRMVASNWHSFFFNKKKNDFILYDRLCLCDFR